MRSLFVALVVGAFCSKSDAQVYDVFDTPLRKSFEQPLSKQSIWKNRKADVDALVNSWENMDTIVVFLVGGIQLHMNPENVHTSGKDLLEYLHDRFNQNGTQVFLRKLQNNVLANGTEDLVCHLVEKAKSKFPGLKFILAGHSYGGSGTVRTARCLDKRNVKVELLVTVDTVWRPVDIGVDVHSIPWNVVRNFHFHQKHGVFQDPKSNHRPDGSTVGIEDYRQFIQKGIFYPHMYCFTNLVRYGLLQNLFTSVIEGSEFFEEQFRQSLDLYLQKHPLE